MAMGFSFTPRVSQTASIAAQGAKDAARNAQSQAQQLGYETERLLMICEALWTFLKEKHGYTDEDLVKRIAEIDLRDGKLDGRVAPEAGDAKACAKCGRPVGRKRPTCLYCGAAVVQDPFQR